MRPNEGQLQFFLALFRMAFGLVTQEKVSKQTASARNKCRFFGFIRLGIGGANIKTFD
jgi:hypothetical protein